jgi:MscS family membrane protein
VYNASLPTFNASWKSHNASLHLYNAFWLSLNASVHFYNASRQWFDGSKHSYSSITFSNHFPTFAKPIMNIAQLLQQKFLNTSIENWLWFAACVVGILLFRFLGSRLITSLIFRFIRKRIGKQGIEALNSFILLPLSRFLVWIALFFASKFIRIPRRVVVFEDEVFFARHAVHIMFELIIILHFIYLLAKAVNFVAYVWEKKAENNELHFDRQLIPFFKDSLKVLIVIFGLLFMVGYVFDKDVTALIGGLGIGGLAIALAAQETLSNLLGSITIFLDKPFRAGDLVDIGTVQGTIERVGLRSTRLRTLDKSYVTVPNKEMVSKVLNNITQSTHRRAKFNLSLVYGTQPDQLKKIIQDIHHLLEVHPKVADDITVRFLEFGESSLNIIVAYLVITNDYDEYAAVREELNYGIYDVVVKNGSYFAYPTRTIKVDSDGMGLLNTLEGEKE